MSIYDKAQSNILDTQLPFRLTPEEVHMILERVMAKHNQNFDSFNEVQRFQSMAGLVQCLEVMSELGYRIEPPRLA